MFYTDFIKVSSIKEETKFTAKIEMIKGSSIKGLILKVFEMSDGHKSWDAYTQGLEGLRPKGKIHKSIWFK